MKQIKQLSMVSFILLLPIVFFVTQQKYVTTPNNPVKMVTLPILSEDPLTAEKKVIEELLKSTQAHTESLTKHLNDIPPTIGKASKKIWLKEHQVKNILVQAKQNGQLSFIVKKLEKMKLPKSLALIPVIESRYHSNAKSNKGAGGIWQLMPTTAKRFGIKNQQRYQLAPSTDAALKYFKNLHNQFGSWELAIAAYNAGDGRVKHALSKNPNATTVQELKLPSETKEYVRRFYQLENYMSRITV